MEEHIPVLYQEILDYLQPRPGGRYIDGTVGAGGHAAGILKQSSPDGRLLALDRDPAAIAFAGNRLSDFGERVILRQASYAQMTDIASTVGFDQVEGILLDLGLSSRQLADAERGFSFRRDGPLDMRFDPSIGWTAAEILNSLSEKELADIFWRYGEEKRSRRYARAIVRERPVYRTEQLAELIARESKKTKMRIHPATRVFQALRIAVNEELNELADGLSAAVQLLAEGGRLAVISFHSLEDRLVKRFIRDLSRDCICPPKQPICNCEAKAVLRPVTRKVIMSSEDEIMNNPRSRSARLRVAESLVGVAK
jgi:16S rRNA (cytosine1402-N4)-methyltransferase